MIKTIEELIEAFGGKEEFGEWAGIGRTGVCNYIARGYIPSALHFRLFIECQRRGLRVSPAIFDMTEDDVRPLIGTVCLPLKAPSGWGAAVK